MASRALLVGGGLVAAGVAFAWVRKIGPFAPPETQIDPSQKITGSGLTSADADALKAAGAPDYIAPTQTEGLDAYQAAARKYMRDVWRPGGVGVPYNVATATPEGNRGRKFMGRANKGDLVRDTGASAFPLSNMGGKTETPWGKTGTSTARGFMVNQYQAAVYSFDAWRIWGALTAGRFVKKTDGSTGWRWLDVFVTPGASQAIDPEGLIYGLGEVYVWDPVENRWLDDSPVPAEQKPRGGSGRPEFQPFPSRYTGDTDGLPRYGYSKTYGENRTIEDLARMAKESRVLKKPW
ncbi:MAG: hypothetical protein EBR30_26985 [Cytophagia bacterium]|nr:hypothetical protein [Cytophagia bacterium]